MDILFLLLGLAIFYAAAAVFAIEHFEKNPAQAAVSFVIPPFAWWLYYHYWERSQKIAFTQIVAFLLFLAGVVLSTWFSDANTKIFHTKVKGMTKEFDSSGYVGSDASLNDLAHAERVSQSLNGRIRGKTFLFNEKVDVAEFDSLGTLRIKHGSDFFGEFEIAIELGELPPQTKNPWKKTIRANSLNAPAIYISWYDKEQQMLRSRKYLKDYNLDLSLVHEEYNKFLAKIQLVLPDPEQSFLVGNIPVFNSRLRFHGEGINKEYDSVETLEAIAAQTIRTTYKRYVQNILGFKDTDFDYRSGDGLGYSNLFVVDDVNVIRMIPLQFYKNDSGWFLDIKGIKDQLKAQENILTSAPSDLRQAVEVDIKNIGNIKQDKVELELVQQSRSEMTPEEPDSSISIDAQENSKPTEIPEVKAPEPVVVSANSEQVKTIQSANLRIDVVAQEANITELLLPFMNKDVELLTQAGKFKNGVYVGVHRKQIVLEVEVGGGVVEFLTDFYNMKSLRVLNSPSTKPQLVEFFNPNAS